MKCLLKRINVFLIAIYHHVYWCMVHSFDFACYWAESLGDVLLTRQLLTRVRLTHPAPHECVLHALRCVPSRCVHVYAWTDGDGTQRNA